MSRLFSLATLFSLLLTSALSAADVKSVFAQLPASCFAEWPGEGDIQLADPQKRKALAAATGEARTSTATAMSLRDVIIDTKNGYIRLESNGDGEGSIFTMALWNCKDGTKLAGVAIERWTNVANDTPHISFWKVEGDTLTDVTKKHLPELTLTSFYDAREAQVKAASKGGFRWWWHLPQKGTTIELKAPSLDLMDEYAELENPDHAYEGRWDGTKFTWVKVKPKPPVP